MYSKYFVFLPFFPLYSVKNIAEKDVPKNKYKYSCGNELYLIHGIIYFNKVAIIKNISALIISLLKI